MFGLSHLLVTTLLDSAMSLVKLGWLTEHNGVRRSQCCRILVTSRHAQKRAGLTGKMNQNCIERSHAVA